MYVYMYVHIYINIHTCAHHIHINIYMNSYIYMYTHIYIYTYIYTHIYLYIYTYTVLFSHSIRRYSSIFAQHKTHLLGSFRCNVRLHCGVTSVDVFLQGHNSTYSYREATPSCKNMQRRVHRRVASLDGHGVCRDMTRCTHVGT